MRGVFLDAGSVGIGDIDLTALEQVLDPLVLYDYTAPGEILERAANASVVVTNKNPLGASVLEQLPGLQLIVVAATGVNNIDLEAARRLGICVCNCRGYATASVVQHTLTLILNLVTGFPESQRRARTSWSQSLHFCLHTRPIAELEDLTLGVIGHGTLGRAVAARMREMGMQVLIAEREGRPPRSGRLPLPEVLGLADVVTLHCPLNHSTEGLIDRKRLAQMKSSAFLVNTARGGLVNDQDLVEALRDGVIAGAALDVLDTEPPPADHPLLTARLPGLIITPHVAWASQPSRQRLTSQIAELVTAWVRGKAFNRV